MKYDFSQLVSPVTQADIMAVKQIYEQKSNNKITLIMGIIVSLFISAIAFVVISSFFSVIASFMSFGIKQPIFIASIAIFILLTVLAIRGTIASYQKTWENNVRLYRFAQANKITLKLQIYNPTYAGMIFGIGDNRSATTVLRDNDNKFEIANYTYSETHGSGDDRHTDYYNYGYIMIQLDKKLPHIVLDSKANNGHFFGTDMSNLPAYFKNNQKLSLEGDFNEYFTLYAPKDYERDALYIFSPDLMATFIDESKQFDVEIIDDKLFIYCSMHFDFSKVTLIQSLFEIINKVGSAVIHNTEHYVDDNIGDRSANFVADPGRRLLKKNNIIIIAIIFCTFFILYEIFPLILSQFLK